MNRRFFILRIIESETINCLKKDEMHGRFINNNNNNNNDNWKTLIWNASTL